MWFMIGLVSIIVISLAILIYDYLKSHKKDIRLLDLEDLAEQYYDKDKVIVEVKKMKDGFFYVVIYYDLKDRSEKRQDLTCLNSYEDILDINEIDRGPDIIVRDFDEDIAIDRALKFMEEAVERKKKEKGKEK